MHALQLNDLPWLHLKFDAQKGSTLQPWYTTIAHTSISFSQNCTNVIYQKNTYQEISHNKFVVKYDEIYD